MSWLMRGLQSAIFHYASCAPCTGYVSRKKRRKEARDAKKMREKRQMEQPELYHHPEPTGTNPFWQEEIIMGPGPPPRRGTRRANTGTAITTAGTHSSNVSRGGSSLDVGPDADHDHDHDHDHDRLSAETLDDDANWNRKRYQREDEHLWGLSELPAPDAVHPPAAGSSVGLAGLDMRPKTSRSSSYYSARAPPVNDLHPPVVSNPSPNPGDNRWMLQPPPKATVMSGKERATIRSRSGSGASSRVELSLQRQVSARQLQQKLERGELPGLPPTGVVSGGSSYNDLLAGQRHNRPQTPLARPPSSLSNSSHGRRRKRRDTAMTRTDTAERPCSSSSSETIVKSRTPPTNTTNATTSPRPIPASSIKVVRVRSSRQQLSTVLSSGSGGNDTTNPAFLSSNDTPTIQNNPENTKNLTTCPRHHSHVTTVSTASSDSLPYYSKHRTPLAHSDRSSLNVLQDLVPPHELHTSRFREGPPVVEARIKLPPSDQEEESGMRRRRTERQGQGQGKGQQGGWWGSGFGVSRAWDGEGESEDEDKDWGRERGRGGLRVPFDSSVELVERDPSLRWSVDF